MVEPTGSETHVIVRIGGADLTCVFRERISLVSKQRVRLKPDTTAVHLFDAGTGVRINQKNRNKQPNL